ncbi:MAG: diacylglycerol kinase [Planctomycetota bacterium]
MYEQKHSPGRGWSEKFADAFRGLKIGVRSQISFFVHFFFAAAVIAAAVVLRAPLTEWAILLLCITLVIMAEMFNTALEYLAQAITDRIDPNVGGALDIGSAAVLVAAVGSAVVGTLLLLNRFALEVGWWSGG